MKAKRIAAMLLTVCMTLSLAACGGKGSDNSDDAGTSDGASGEGGEITVQIGPNPETLDPALNSAIDGANMLITLFEPLLIIDENNEVQPGQAEEYEVSEDGLVWTFTMRDGLKWSDGSDLTAKDFEYTFKRLCDTELAAPYGETVVGMIDGYVDALG